MSNPYNEPKEYVVRSGTDLFGNFRFQPTKKKATERGELLRYFCRKLGLDEKKQIAFVAFKVTGMSVVDLYYLKSICDTYEKEGRGSWGKCFNGSIKYTPKAR